MKIINGALLRGLLSTATLCWSGAALLCSLEIVLPARTFTLWLVTVLAKESSLLVTALAFLGLVLAELVRLLGAPRRAAVAAALSTAAIVLSLMPVAQAMHSRRGGLLWPFHGFGTFPIAASVPHATTFQTVACHKLQ